LCGLEHVVLLEYLYAYYSLKQPEDFTNSRNSADVLFVRHELLGIAVSEMRHLRWANQLLWTLAQRRLIRDRGPALEPGRKVPTATGERDRQLRPLALPALDDFIAVERPSGTLDGAYARVVATLRLGYRCCNSPAKSWRRGWITTTVSGRSMSSCVPGRACRAALESPGFAQSKSGVPKRLEKHSMCITASCAISPTRIGAAIWRMPAKSSTRGSK
jgi:hypothetical protein